MSGKLCLHCGQQTEAPHETAHACMAAMGVTAKLERLAETVSLLKHRCRRLICMGERASPELRYEREWAKEKEGVELR